MDRPLYVRINETDDGDTAHQPILIPPFSFGLIPPTTMLRQRAITVLWDNRWTPGSVSWDVTDDTGRIVMEGERL